MPRTRTCQRAPARQHRAWGLRVRSSQRGEAAKLRAVIAEHLPQIIEKLTQAALSGGLSAARLLLERVTPPMKAAEEAAEMTLPDGTLTERGNAVLASIATGGLAPLQGAAVLAALGTLAKLKETDELTRRIEALEAKGAA